MQHHHSCGTLESRIEIFGCMVQELENTFYPLDHYPLLHRAYVHTKRGLTLSKLSSDQGDSSPCLKIEIPRSELEI